MIDIDAYVKSLTDECVGAFGKRLAYIGLQGSYMRGEAHDGSDIDIMVVIDEMTVADLDAYRAVLERVGHFELSCGFICGVAELARWNPLEICNLLHATKDVYGELKPLVPEYKRTDAINFLKLSVGNAYHILCHSYLHAKNQKDAARLAELYKGVFFIIQNLHYLESGEFIVGKKALAARADKADAEILSMPQSGFDFDTAFGKLYDWCCGALARLSEIK